MIVEFSWNFKCGSEFNYWYLYNCSVVPIKKNRFFSKIYYLFLEEEDIYILIFFPVMENLYFKIPMMENLSFKTQWKK